MPSGLPGATMISSELVAKTSGAPEMPPASTTFCMLAWSAEAKTSAGAFSSICWASADEAPKLRVTFGVGVGRSRRRRRPR